MSQANATLSETAFWRCPKKISFVAWLSVAQTVSWGTTFYAFALFIAPFDHDFGWSKADITGAFTLSLLLMGFAGISAGTILDRFGGRWLMTAGSLLNAVCLTLLSLVGDLVPLYLIWLGLGLAMATTLYPPGFAVVVATLRDESRHGVTLMTLIAGFASTVFIPITAYLIQGIGWRDALLVLAACNLLICVPIHWTVLRKERIPGGGGGRPRFFSIDLKEGATAAAIRNPRLWWLALCFSFQSMMMTGVTVHIIPLLTEYGFALATIIIITAMIGPMQVAGRLFITFTSRWIGFRGAGMFSLTAPLFSLVILGTANPAFSLIFIFPIIYGSANGIITIVRALAVPELIGPQAYGALNGLLGLASAITLAAAPVIISWTWEISQSYTAPLILLFVMALVALFAFFQATKGGLAKSNISPRDLT